MRTTVLDAADTAKVAENNYRKTDHITPLVSTVTAGSAGSAGSGKDRKSKKNKKRGGRIPTLVSLLQQVSAVGVAPGSLSIDPSFTSDNLSAGHVAEVNECESELLDFIRGGKPGIVFDDPGWIAEAVSARVSGGSPLRVAQEYYAWREARRVFCGQLHQYLAYVEQDEANRQKAEQDIRILPDVRYNTPEGKAAIASGREQILSRLQGLAAYMGTDRGQWEVDDLLDRLGDMPGLKPLPASEPEDREEMLRTFGALLFADRLGDDIHPTCRAMEIETALRLAATYLDAPMGSPENQLLIAAAVAVGRIRGTENRKAPDFTD